MVYRLAFVTGATSGIGKVTCELIADKGIDLMISGRNQAMLQQLQESLSHKVAVEIIPADLSNENERQILIQHLHDKLPDIIVNNAGFGLYGDALTYSTHEQAKILEVNGKAVLELTMEAARALISNEKKGVILNVSSAAAFQIFPGMAVYAASKTFVNHFSQAFDFEVKRHGVRVLTLCPGMVSTDFQRRAGGVTLDRQMGSMSPLYIAEQIWKQIEKLEPLLIVDWKYRLLTFISNFIPKKWIAAIVEQNVAKRIPPRELKR